MPESARDAGVDAGPDAGLDAGPPEVRCAESDYVFTMPYREPPSPERGEADVTVGVRLLDVYVLFDVTGSMSGEIDAMRDAVVALLGTLTCRERPGSTCVRDTDCPSGYVCGRGSCVENPGASGCVADLRSGAGSYEADYMHHLSIQPDAARTAAALPTETFGGTEELYEAVMWIAEPPPMLVGCSVEGIGCPGFREEAARVLLAITDEDSDGPVLASEAGAALIRQGILFAGIWSGAERMGRSDLEDLATESESIVDGMPLVFDGMDASVVAAVTAALRAATVSRTAWIRGDVEDLPADAGDALHLVDHVEVDMSDEGCLRGEPTMDRDTDGWPDTILAPSGARVCFDVVARTNETVPEAREAQIFLARLVVRAGDSFLAERSLCFMVPPAP